MKRKKIDIDEVLKRSWAKPSKEDIEKSRTEVLDRLRDELGGKMAEFNLSAEETPASKAVRMLKRTDRLVLRAIQILAGKADLYKMPAIVSELGQPVDLDDIMMSLKRLDRKGAISMKALFPMDAPVQEAAAETEEFKAGNLAKEKLT